MDNQLNIRELRIGSYLKYGAFQWVIVGSVDIDNIIGFNFPETNNYAFDDIDAFEPIPITPEWLERLGFVQHENDKKAFRLSFIESKSVHCSIRGSGDYLVQAFSDTAEAKKRISYVHELQDFVLVNLGEELTIGESE